jgi:hypothetical protein
MFYQGMQILQRAGKAPTPPDPRLFDISAFSRFSYQDYLSIPMRLPVLPIYTFYPGDYRSQDQL